jgi:hypothetical protein
LEKWKGSELIIDFNDLRWGWWSEEVGWPKVGYLYHHYFEDMKPFDDAAFIPLLDYNGYTDEYFVRGKALDVGGGDPDPAHHDVRDGELYIPPLRVTCLDATGPRRNIPLAASVPLVKAPPKAAKWSTGEVVAAIVGSIIAGLLLVDYLAQFRTERYRDQFRPPPGFKLPRPDESLTEKKERNFRLRQENSSLRQKIAELRLRIEKE